MFDDKDACQLEQADGLEYINEQADVVAGYWRKEDGFYGVAVIDKDTGEIMHMALCGSVERSTHKQKKGVLL